MAFILRKNPIKSLESEIGTLTDRRGGVLRRLEDATRAAEAANAEQRRLLIDTDGSDAAALRRAAEACRTAADRRAGLEDAARELASRISDAEQSLAAERDRIERERAAAELTAKIDRLAACIAAEEQAVRALAQAHEATRQAAYSAFPDPADAIAGPSPFIGELKATALHVAFPAEYPIPPFSRSLATRTATLGEAAAGYLATLRTRAEALRTGSAPIAAPTIPEAA